MSVLRFPFFHELVKVVTVDIMQCADVYSIACQQKRIALSLIERSLTALFRQLQYNQCQVINPEVMLTLMPVSHFEIILPDVCERRTSRKQFDV